MVTLLFVHGTGVRKAGYEQTLKVIREGLYRADFHSIDVRGTPWGDEFGIKLDRLPDTLPLEITKALATEPPPAEIDAQLWDQLLEDPLFELRLVAGLPVTSPVGAGAPTPAIPLPKTDLPEAAAAARLTALPAKLVDVSRFGITASELKVAAERIAKEPVFAEAVRRFGSATDPGLATATARATVAAVLFPLRFDQPGSAPAVLYNAALREQLVVEITAVLAPTPTKSVIGDWLRAKAIDFVKPRAANFVRERRAGLTGASLPAIGDILFYQRRGDEIRNRIAQDLADLPRPVIALGHSLGGIMLIDLLARAGRPSVDLLITVGSQSPLFFIIDALDTLRPNSPGGPFTPWLNVFDRGDMLSFCAERTFKGVQGIHDREVASGVPFPDSHSAYWFQDSLYRAMREFWPK